VDQRRNRAVPRAARILHETVKVLVAIALAIATLEVYINLRNTHPFLQPRHSAMLTALT
jgi:hypothetical protein